MRSRHSRIVSASASPGLVGQHPVLRNAENRESDAPGITITSSATGTASAMSFMAFGIEVLRHQSLVANKEQPVPTL